MQAFFNPSINFHIGTHICLENATFSGVFNLSFADFAVDFVDLKKCVDLPIRFDCFFRTLSN